jgi:putative component of membrane protein insertase Oxa1/YidC/SpoIIIJ protein YidD
MQKTWFSSNLSQITILAINGYQKYISPRKGFSCSYRILYGGESCSQYVKRMFKEQDFSDAIKAARQRFIACKTAHNLLKSQIISCGNQSNRNNYRPIPLGMETSSEPQSCKKKRYFDCCDCCDLDTLRCGVWGYEKIQGCIPQFDCCNYELGCSFSNLSFCDCSFLDCGSCCVIS